MKRRFFLGGFVAMAVSLGAASVAFACQSLATLSVSPRSGAAGATVTLSGGKYNTSSTASPVSVRLDSRGGPVVATITPGSNGAFSQAITLPSDLSPGYHILLGTQTTTSASGVQIAGAPGRTSYQVEGGASTAGALGKGLTGPAGIAGIAALAVIAGGAGYGAMRKRRSASTGGAQA